MRVTATLSEKEKEVTSLIAWGATKKEVANMLSISERTVENHTRAIFKKTGCSKSNELSAWYFCTNYNIPFSNSPLKQRSYEKATFC
jgi:DNA-binding CsgD family transcriptional regulator